MVGNTSVKFRKIVAVRVTVKTYLLVAFDGLYIQKGQVWNAVVFYRIKRCEYSILIMLFKNIIITTITPISWSQSRKIPMLRNEIHFGQYPEHPISHHTTPHTTSSSLYGITVKRDRWLRLDDQQKTNLSTLTFTYTGCKCI